MGLCYNESIGVKLQIRENVSIFTIGVTVVILIFVIVIIIHTGRCFFGFCKQSQIFYFRRKVPCSLTPSPSSKYLTCNLKALFWSESNVLATIKSWDLDRIVLHDCTFHLMHFHFSSYNCLVYLAA